MRNSKYLITSVSLFLLITGCAANEQHSVQVKTVVPPVSSDQTTPTLKGGTESAVRQDQTVVPTSEKTLAQVYYSGTSQAKQVALTFDDGPDDHYTPLILDVLKNNNVKATFFIVGERAKAHPDLVKRMVSEGHAIGNHSWDHPDFSKLTTKQAADEVSQTQDELNSIVGFRPSLFRPPYGALSSSNKQMLSDMGLHIIDWSVDTRDWAGTPTPKIMEYVRKELKPGGIILEHCAGGRNENLSNTVSALEQIIPLLKKEGYDFVTVPTLLSLSPTSP